MNPQMTFTRAKKLENDLHQIRSINSRDEEWEKGHFYMQWNGLNDLVAETIIENQKDEWFVYECICLAREMRKELLRRYDYITFGRYNILPRSYF